MARHLVRLKLALLANALRSSRRQRLATVFGSVLVLPPTGSAFVALATAGDSERHGPALLVGAFTLAFAFWLVYPLFAFGTDETLDPARLALLPLRRRDLMLGLFLASAVGVPPVATLLALSGTIVGFAPAGAGAIVVVAAVLVELALCLAASRALATTLSGALRSRRGRDVVILVTVLAGSALGLAWNVVVFGGQELDLGRARELVDPAVAVLGWLPPGAAAQAAAHAQDGELPPALARLAVAGAGVGLLLLCWTATLGRSLTSVESSARQRRSTERPLVPGWLPRDRLGVVAAKELRYWQRDPRLRGSIAAFAATATAILVLVALTGDAPGEAVFAVPLFAWFTGIQALNQFGYDRAAFWTNAVASGDPLDDLLGKNLALTLVAGLPTVLLAVGLAALSGGWALLPVALALAVAAFAVSLAVGNVVSVRLPQPMPESASSLWPTSGPGQNFVKSFVLLLAVGVQVLLLAPVAVATGVAAASSPPALALVAALALPYGWGLWRVGVAIASERLRPCQPELLAALDPKRV